MRRGSPRAVFAHTRSRRRRLRVHRAIPHGMHATLHGRLAPPAGACRHALQSAMQWRPSLTVRARRDERVVGDDVGAAILLVHAVEEVERHLAAPRLLARRDQAAVRDDVALAAAPHHVLQVAARKKEKRQARAVSLGCRTCLPGVMLMRRVQQQSCVRLSLLVRSNGPSHMWQKTYQSSPPLQLCSPMRRNADADADATPACPRGTSPGTPQARARPAPSCRTR